MDKSLNNRQFITRHCLPEPEIPFTKEEFANRLGRVREAMQESNIDVLFVSSPEGLYYVSGFLSEWYQAQSPVIWPPASGIAIHRDSGATMHFETAMDEVLARFTSISPDIRIHRDGQRTMIDFITAELASAGWLSGTVGLEMFSYRPNRGHSEQFEASLQARGATVVDATAILRDVRRIKSPQELIYLREAGAIADIGMAAALNALTVGATELDVHAEMTYAMLKAGGEPAAIYLPVASGKKTAATHALASRKKIQAGEIVVVDICGVRHRYHTNLARTFSMGVPLCTVEQHIRRSAEVFAELPEILEPRMRVAELTQFVIDYYQRHSLWDDRGWLGGYELGIAMPPDWDGPFTYDVETDPGQTTLDPGMVINLESKVYLPQGAGCSMVINTMAFSETQVSMLTEFPNTLQIIE